MHSNKKILKHVVLAFFCDFPAENLIGAETVQYFGSTLWNWKFYQEHFLMKNEFDIN